MARFAVILPAAGRSTRFGGPDQKKIFMELDGRAVWLRAAEPFLNRDDVGQVIVVIAPEDRERFERRFHANVAFLGIRVVDGGAERFDSVARALAVVDPSCDFVAVHDAARPCVTAAQVDAVFAAAREQGASLLAVPVADTLKRGDAQGLTAETVPRAGLFAAQTPQVFRRDWLEAAYARRNEVAGSITDDAQLVEALGHHCRLVAGSSHNLKITTRDDLVVAAAVLQAQAQAERENERPAHPFADERAGWDDLPRPRLQDLF